MHDMAGGWAGGWAGGSGAGRHVRHVVKRCLQQTSTAGSAAPANASFIVRRVLNPRPWPQGLAYLFLYAFIQCAAGGHLCLSSISRRRPSLVGSALRAAMSGTRCGLHWETMKKETLNISLQGGQHTGGAALQGSRQCEGGAM